MQGTLEVWINAFIPRDVGSYTQTVGGGDHAGQTAVPLPGVARLNPLNLLKPWNEGFLTDQRGFSDQQNASTRMQSSATFGISPHALTTKVNPATTSGTVAIDIKSGKLLGSAGADLSGCSASIEEGARVTENILTKDRLVAGVRSAIVHLNGAGADPLVSASADIDYNVSIQVIHEHQNDVLKVVLKGKIDDFPAFEAYARFGDSVQTLFTSPPPKGNTVVDLLGYAKRRVSGSVKWPIK